MHYGLGTHFNAPVSMERLRHVAERFTSARLDVQTTEPRDARQWIADCESVGLHTLPIVDTHDQQRELPDGGWVEYQNEVNIGLGRPAPIPVHQYRDGVLSAYDIAKVKGQTLCVGAAANFEKRDVQWFRALDVPAFPSDIIIATHHYTPRRTFESAHRLDWKPWNWTREYEVRQFLDAIGPTRRWIITEFGYRNGPNDDLSPAEAAVQITKEWQFWARQPNCLGAWLYQIGDSPVDDHDFGLFDEHGNLKQQIFETVPMKETTMLEVTEAISRSDLFTHPSLSDHYIVRYPSTSSLTVLSVQPDGRIETRPINAIGPWETCRIEGNRLVFPDVDGKRFALLLVD